MGNGIESSPELDGGTPLELALDRAMDQYMASQQERRARQRSAQRAVATTAMVVDAPRDVLPARLSWRGIEVTEDFQEYASRVARGEQLAPYRGQVLARPCPDFPWSAPPEEQPSTDTEALPRFRSRAPRVAAWFFGVGALLMTGLGIGSGATSPTEELDPFARTTPAPPTTTETTTLALHAPLADEPAPLVEEPETRIATAIQGALARASAISSAAVHAPPPAGAAVERSGRVLRTAPRLAAPLSPLQRALARGALENPPPAPTAPAPSGALASAGNLMLGTSASLATSATNAGAPLGPGAASPLFAERAPF